MATIKKAQFGAPVRKGCYRGGCAATTSGADRAERREARQAERDYKKAIRVAGREERKAERAERKAPKAQAGMKASNKRVGPVDPRGAWTKVQEQTLAGKRTPVSLKKDKELGATSMAKGGKWIQKAIKKPGALRKSLGAKPGKPIPAAKLAKAAKAPGKLGQRARLAQTLKKMKK